MPDDGTAVDQRASRLRSTKTLLAIAILLLLGQVAWQQMQISGLRAGLDQAHRDLVTRVDTLATQKVQGHREELVAVAYVDALYRSVDGLQRPVGLYNAEARQSIADAIKGSDEWRRKHARP